MDWNKVAMAGPLGPMEWQRQHQADQKKNALEYEIGTLPIGQSKQINSRAKVTHDPNGGFNLEVDHLQPRHFPSSYALIDYLIHYSNLDLI